MSENIDNSQRFKEIHHLSDYPSSEDEFEEISHTRVADALAETIKSSEHGGKAIGLEGTWGSGKSTVIEILKTKLYNDKINKNKYHVFTFDLWAHQSDPIRRSFLHELVTWLVGKRLLLEDYGKEKLEKIHAREKNITSSTIPSFSFLGKILILLLPIFPLAYMWLSPLIFSSTTEEQAIVYGFAKVALIIFCVLYIALCISLIVKYLFDKNFNFNNEIAVFSQKNDQKITTTQLIRDEKPTTIEFNNIFDDIINNIVPKSTNAIVVLDNLDRLPTHQIKDVWASMRNFFSSSKDSPRSETLKKVWLIVPYDIKHILAVYNEDTPPKYNHDTYNVPNNNFNAEDFIEKTFEIIFKVSPPLLSHWQSYLDSKLKIVFDNNLSDLEKYNLFRILEIYFSDDNQPITPRSIKSYINKIVSLLMQWNNIPIDCIALYTLYKKKIEGNISLLKEQTLFNHSRTQDLVRNSDYYKYLAALHFNVLPDVSYEILLSSDIHRALEKSDRSTLVKLQKSSGFETVLSPLIENYAKSWANSNIKTFTSVCCNLEQLTFTHQSAEREIWRTLGLATENLGQWEVLTQNDEEGLNALIRSLDDDLAWNAACNIRDSLKQIGGKLKSDSEAGEQWTKILNSISAVLRTKNSYQKTYLDKLSIPGDHLFLYGVASASDDLEFIDFKNFKTEVSKEELTTLVVSDVENEELDRDLLNMIHSLSSRPSICNWEQIIESTTNRLESFKPQLTTQEINTLLGVYTFLYKIKEVKNIAENALTQLATDGTLLCFVNTGISKPDLKLAATAFWCLGPVSKKSLDFGSHYGMFTQ